MPVLHWVPPLLELLELLLDELLLDVLVLVLVLDVLVLDELVLLLELLLELDPPSGHGPQSTSQFEHVSPRSHVPSPQYGGKQSAGSVVLPMHSSQWPQLLKQPITGWQVWHLVGSLTLAMSHEPLPLPSSEPSHTNLPVPAGSSQQPKQSQPFGVSGLQKSRQACDCAA